MWLDNIKRDIAILYFKFRCRSKCGSKIIFVLNLLNEDALPLSDMVVFQNLS